MKRVLVVDPIAPAGEEYLARHAEIVRSPDSDPATIRRLAADADGIITRSKLPDDLFERLVLRPHAKLVARLREIGVDQPLIGFPRGSAALAERYAREINMQAVGLDTACPLAVGRAVQAIKPIQGALDPLLLRAGGPALDRRIDQLMEAWGDGPWIFNLGHGILPDTPIAHVEQTLKRIRQR